MPVRIYQLICILIFAFPLIANGKTVSLSSKSGDLEINGSLLDFDGRYYSIASEYGDVVLDAKLFNCSGDGCLGNFSDTELLRISTLPSLHAILLPSLIKNFARLSAGTIEETEEGGQTNFIILRGDRELRIKLQKTPDEIASQNLIKHDADIALITRNLTKDEVTQRLRNSDTSIWPIPKSRVIALDAYVPAISRNPSKTMFKLDDIATIGHVSLHTPSNVNILGRVPADETIFHSSAQNLLDALNENEDVVGILPFSQMRDTQILGLEVSCGALPAISHRSIKSRDYAWSAPIYMHITDLQLGPQGQEFIDYLSSLSAQRVIQRAGFIDLTPEVIPLNAQGERLALSVQSANTEQFVELQDLLNTLEGASRLTTTLVLEDEQDTLDVRSTSELTHLYRFLGSDRHDFKEVLVVGLTGAAKQGHLDSLLDEVSVKIGKGMINTVGSINAIQTHSFAGSFPYMCDLDMTNMPRIEIWAR